MLTTIEGAQNPIKEAFTSESVAEFEKGTLRGKALPLLPDDINKDNLKTTLGNEFDDYIDNPHVLESTQGKGQDNMVMVNVADYPEIKEMTTLFITQTVGDKPTIVICNTSKSEHTQPVYLSALISPCCVCTRS